MSEKNKEGIGDCVCTQTWKEPVAADIDVFEATPDELEDIELPEKAEKNIKKQSEDVMSLHSFIIGKLNTDSYCFAGKHEVNVEEEPLHVVPVGKGVDRGVVAFAGVCEKHYKELQEEYEKQIKQEVN